MKDISQMGLKELDEFERKVFMSDASADHKESILRQIDERRNKLDQSNAMVEMSELTDFGS